MPTKTKEDKQGIIKTQVLNNSNEILSDLGEYWQRIYRAMYSGYAPNSLFVNSPYDGMACYDELYETTISDAYGTYDYKRKSMGMPLKISQYLKNLVFGEGVKITIADEKKMEWFTEWLKYNDFFTNEKNLFEQQIAVGDKAETIYKSGEKILLNYMPSHRFIVTEFDGIQPKGMITVSYRQIMVKNKTKWLTLLEWHRLEKEQITATEPPMFTNNMVITREIYMSDKQYYIEELVPYNKYITHFGTLQETETVKDVDMPLFEFCKNPLNNSKAPTSYRGMSIYGGSLDQEQVLTTTYDGFYFEYLLKQYIVTAPEEAVDDYRGKDGNSKRKYNPRIGALVSMGQQGDYQTEWKDFSPEIRDQSFINGINLQLDIYVSGHFSGGTFRYDGKSIQTATQVIAERSDSFRTKVEFQNTLAASWKRLFVKVATYAKKWNMIKWDLTEEEITIKFDDSIIIDDQQEFTNDLQAVSADIMPKAIFRERHYSLSEKEEKRWQKLLEEEQKSLFGFNEEPEEIDDTNPED